MVVDVHDHFVPPAFAELVRRRGPDLATELVREGEHEHFLIEGTARRSYDPRLYDLETRREQMAEDGVDLQILSCLPFMTYYGIPPEDGLAVARLVNDGLAEAVAADPAHFTALATVPLQDPPAAARELERAVRGLGMVGVQILTAVPGRPLDDAALRPFWEAAAGLGVPVLIHPFEAVPTGELARHQLGNLLGNPFGTATAAALLILSGLLDQLPGLVPVLAHGGGALPFVIGRLDRGWSGNPGQVGPGLAGPPSAHLRRFAFDTITFSAPALRYLVELVGGDRVLLGTDYPTGMMQAAPLAALEAAGLAPEVRDLVVGENARRIFGLGRGAAGAGEVAGRG